MPSGGPVGPQFDLGKIVLLLAVAALTASGPTIAQQIEIAVAPSPKVSKPPKRPDEECDPEVDPECKNPKVVIGYRAEPRERMLVDANGNVSIPYVKGRRRLGVKLHIGFDKARAIWWLNKPQKGWVVEFKVPKSYLEWLRAVALPETPAQRFFPARVDLEWRDQYSIPPLLIPALEGTIIPGSGRKVYDASKLR